MLELFRMISIIYRPDKHNLQTKMISFQDQIKLIEKMNDGLVLSLDELDSYKR